MQTKDKNILLEASELVFGARPRDYGTPHENFTLIAKYWGAHLDREISIEDVGIMMSLLKLARLRATSTEDSWKDLGGYALATLIARESDAGLEMADGPTEAAQRIIPDTYAFKGLEYHISEDGTGYAEVRPYKPVVPWSPGATEEDQIYIAGPMQDIPGFNYEAFDRAEAWLRKKYPNAVIHNPAKMDRDKGYTADELYQMKLDRPEEFKKLRHDMLKDDLRIILNCKHLFLLPGWAESDGARTERNAALGCGIHVDYIPFCVGFQQKARPEIGRSAEQGP